MRHGCGRLSLILPGEPIETASVNGSKADTSTAMHASSHLPGAGSRSLPSSSSRHITSLIKTILLTFIPLQMESLARHPRSSSKQMENVSGPSRCPQVVADLSSTDGHQMLSMKQLRQHDVMHSKPAPPLEWIVVRIEIKDTGCGIRPKDMVQSKLFSAFNQTEQGRQQGGFPFVIIG